MKTLLTTVAAALVAAPGSAPAPPSITVEAVGTHHDGFAKVRVTSSIDGFVVCHSYGTSTHARSADLCRTVKAGQPIEITVAVSGFNAMSYDDISAHASLWPTKADAEAHKAPVAQGAVHVKDSERADND